MSRAAAVRLLVLAMALALLAVPSLATASPLDFPFRLPAGVPPRLRALVRERTDAGASHAPFKSEFELKAGNGYRLGVFGLGDAVIVEVARSHGSAVTAYIARGTVTPDRLDASFGELGKVAMGFRPSGRTTLSKPLRNCRGASRYSRRLGVFVGDLRFRSENGYVSVHAHRTKGRVLTSLEPHCGGARAGWRAERAARPSAGAPAISEPSFLSASWRHAVASASFAVLDDGEKALFVATAEQSEGRLAKVHFAIETGSPRALAVDDALTLARVSPPAPFKGTGTYRAAPDGTTTWTGALSVNFPGAARFPLTGPPFEAAVEKGF